MKSPQSETWRTVEPFDPCIRELVEGFKPEIPCGCWKCKNAKVPPLKICWPKEEEDADQG